MGASRATPEPRPSLELAGRGPRGSTRPPWWLRALRFGVTAGLVAYLAWRVDLGEVGRTIASVDPLLLSVGIGVAFFDRGVMAAKWSLLARVQDPSITLVRALRAYLAAGFGALIVPTPVTGDVLRAMALGRGSGALAGISASIVAERLLGMMASGLLCLVALHVAVQMSEGLDYLVPWTAGFLVVASVVFVLPLSRFGASRLTFVPARVVPPALSGRIQRFVAAYAVYRKTRGTLAGVALLTLFEQTLPILNLAVLAMALQLPIRFKMLVVAVPLSVFVARLPISVAGIGVGETALVYLLGLFGVPAYQALALGLTGSLMNLVVAIPGAFLWRDVMGRRPAR